MPQPSSGSSTRSTQLWSEIHRTSSAVMLFLVSSIETAISLVIVKYSLGVPFTEKFFDLAFEPDNLGRPAGYVGMITANSFMKREFGKKLIEQFIPTWDLTHVVDTGSLRPEGHTTPTVILFGRHQRPVNDALTVVSGIKGEQPQPVDLGSGRVWKSILSMIDTGPNQNEFVSVAQVERSRLAQHPWSIGGGGAAELKDEIDVGNVARLSSLVTSIGKPSFPGIDDMFIGPRDSFDRQQVEFVRPLVIGESVHDWGLVDGGAAFVPYDDDFEPIPLDRESHWYRYVWSFRTISSEAVSFGGKTRSQLGDDWWTWYRWIPGRYRIRL